TIKNDTIADETTDEIKTVLVFFAYIKVILHALVSWPFAFLRNKVFDHVIVNTTNRGKIEDIDRIADLQISPYKIEYSMKQFAKDRGFKMPMDRYNTEENIFVSLSIDDFAGKCNGGTLYFLREILEGKKGKTAIAKEFHGGVPLAGSISHAIYK